MLSLLLYMVNILSHYTRSCHENLLHNRMLSLHTVLHLAKDCSMQTSGRSRHWQLPQIVAAMNMLLHVEYNMGKFSMFLLP